MKTPAGYRTDRKNTTVSSFRLLGVRVHGTNIPEVLEFIENASRTHRKGYITITGVHGIIECQKHADVWQAHEDAWLTVPDGMPLVYIGRLRGYGRMQRCYGPDLMLAVMRESVIKGWTHFFYGGKPGVAEALKQEMEKRFPGVRIVGTYTPPFRPLNQEERHSLISQIAVLKPDIFWVGLSTPKQELFMHEFLPILDTKIMIGVGAAFDFHTGQVRQAPRWVQQLSLEWFFRTLMEPRRLLRRYAKIVPLFLFLYALQTFGFRPNAPGWMIRGNKNRGARS